MAVLPPGYELVARRAAPGEDAPRYRIRGVAGNPGGFGITYVAEKLPAERPAGNDFSRRLWLQPGVRVAIKEHFPQRMAARAADGVRVIPAGDGEAATFGIYLKRFQKEAERLFLLTLLFIVRAADGAPGGAAQAMAARFLRELAGGVKRGSEKHLIAGAMQVIDQFDAAQRGLARRELAERGLPTVYDYFAANGTAYYVMEFLEGGTMFQRLMPPRAPLDYAGEFVPLAARLIDSLTEIHTGLPGQPLIHCDIKPGNIMFRDRSMVRPVLIDFGLTRSVAAEGPSLFYGHNAAYASPEQAAEARGEPVQHKDAVGPRIDIYATGKVLFEAARGRIGGAEGGLPDGYPPAALRAMTAATMNDWQRRPASAAAWRAMLFGTGAAAGGRPRPRTLAPVAVALALALGATGVWAMRQMLAAPDAPAEAAPTATATPLAVVSPSAAAPAGVTPASAPSAAPGERHTLPTPSPGATTPPAPVPAPSAAPTLVAPATPPPDATVPPPPLDLAAIGNLLGVSLAPDARGGYEIFGRRAGSGDWANGAKHFTRACDGTGVARALARAQAAGHVCLVGVDADGKHPRHYTWPGAGAEAPAVAVRHGRLSDALPGQGH